MGLDRTDVPDAEPIPTFDEGYWVRNLVFYENLNYGDTWVHPTLGGGIAHLVVKALGTQEQIDQWYTPVVEKGLETAFRADRAALRFRHLSGGDHRDA